MRTRLTRDGWVLGVLASALTAVAAFSGNNLLVLVAAALWAVGLVAVPLGAWNLRGLVVRRMLPAELFAGRDASGQLLVRNGRRWGASGALEVLDRGTLAAGEVSALPAGRTASVPARWCFDRRGPAQLSVVEIRSTFPFGLAEHRVDLPVPAQLLVYPRPLPASAVGRRRRGAGEQPVDRAGGTGDFHGLRAFRPGDSRRRVHWPTSARLGQIVVVERNTETEMAVEVEVRAARGVAWERELSRATGEVQRAFGQGRTVGLVLPATPQRPARRLPPSTGGMWRRTLLDALALQPELSE